MQGSTNKQPLRKAETGMSPFVFQRKRRHFCNQRTKTHRGPLSSLRTMLEADHGLVAVARVSHAQAGQLRSLGHENVTRKPLTFVTDSPLTRTFYDSRNSRGFSHPRVRLFQPHQPFPRVNHVLRLTRDRTGPTASHGGATLRNPDRALLPFGHMCESIPVSAPADGM